MARLSELRQYQFAARYGDYVGKICAELKLKAKEHSTKHFEAITGWGVYWTDIARQLAREDSKWRRFIIGDKTVTEDMVKTRLAVYDACTYIGLNFDDTVQVINMYGERNNLVHSSVLQMAEGLWNDLRTSLHHDLRDLPLVISQPSSALFLPTSGATEHSRLRNSDQSEMELSRSRRPPPKNPEITWINTGPQLRQIPKSILTTNHFFNLLLARPALLPSL